MPELNQLKAVMKEQGWTNASLAKKTRLVIRTIGNAKAGESVSASTARAICKATGKRIEELR